MATFTRHRKHSIIVEGQPVEIQVSRLSVSQAGEFSTWFTTFMAELKDARVLDGDDLEMVTRAFTDYVSLSPGQIEIDGESVTTGAQMLQLFGEQGSVVIQVLACIARLQLVSKSQGEASASACDSLPTSGARETAADGPVPETTAEPVSDQDYASPEDVAEETASPSSGATTTSI